MSLPPGSRLGLYEVVTELGRGGMGEVYRARDPNLRRDVALKVLRTLRAWDPDAVARFEQEALSLASLSHPNIVTVFEMGRSGSTPFVVTELLEGMTLRERLNAGPLPSREAAGLAVQVLQGLGAAHRKGIVHRDLKPENLFITEGGLLKILDFGLAKSSRFVPPGPGSDARTRITDALMVVGTAGYMSPEQVRGLTVDPRSDLFSFGLILHEMLSGRRAFERETAAETMTAILREPAPDLPSEVARAAPELDAIVRRCLEKDPARRFESAEEISGLLERGDRSRSLPASTARRTRHRVFAGLALVAAVALVTLVAGPYRGRGSVPVAKRIAVLPFENVGEERSAYFAQGVADAVRGKLSSLPGLDVIARGSSASALASGATPASIARELGVRYVLTGRVRWQGPEERRRVHVTPELVEVAADRPPRVTWQQSFDAEFTDVFDVEAEIATRVAESLGLALGAVDEKRLAEKPTRNLAAYDAFLRAEEWAAIGTGAVDPIAVARAAVLYEQSVTLDHSFALAWARLASVNAYACVLEGGKPRPVLVERVREAMQRAKALAPGRPETQMAEGLYRFGVLEDFPSALHAFDAGLRAAPRRADFLREAGWTEAHLGRWDAAVAHLSQAEQLDPRSVLVLRRHGYALLFLRRYPQARRAFERGLALAPANLNLLLNRAATFLGEGDLAAARAAIRNPPPEVQPAAIVAQAARFVPFLLSEPQRDLLFKLSAADFGGDRAAWALTLAQAWASRGRPERAQPLAEEARATFEERLDAELPGASKTRSDLGLALALLGRRAEAIRAGEESVSDSSAQNAFDEPVLRAALARIYAMAGEPEKAADEIERILGQPFSLSRAWLRIDPTYDPLRASPRYRSLIAGS